jgi:hypothetical protein
MGGVAMVATGAAGGFAAGPGLEFCADPASGAISRTKNAKRSTEYLLLQFNGIKCGGNDWQFDAFERERESGRDGMESNRDQNLMLGARILIAGVKTMTKQFENPEAEKLEDETVADPTAEETIERIADKAAAKPGKTEQKFDKEHTIFSN